MQKQKVTIYDVAREAKVSMATVSRVVNGNTNVRQETRDRVLAVIKRLHYQPNAVAQGLASKKTTTIGLFVPDLTNLYFSELSKGIDDIAMIYKYNIILSSIENRLMREGDVIQGLLNKQVDGIIYMSNRLSKEAEEAFLRTKTPVVLAGTLDNDGHLPSVNIDYIKADTEAFELMYASGKKNIAIAVGDSEAVINKQHRLVAYRRFLEAHHLGEGHVYRNIQNYADGYNLYAQLKQEKIDGIFVTKDLPSAGIVNAASEKGTKVPEDLEIITATATDIVKVVRPKLTAVKQPLYDIGAVAMRMLTKLMGDEPLEDKKVVLPYALEKNDSTSTR